MTEWNGEDRRKEIRRQEDKAVCPFHKIKCDAIHTNATNIHDIEGKMATKEDLNRVIDDVKTRAPRWVVITMITITSMRLGWMVLGMEVKFDSIYVMKANQEILLKAFHIEPVKTVQEAEKEINGTKKGGD